MHAKIKTAKSQMPELKESEITQSNKAQGKVLNALLHYSQFEHAELRDLYEETNVDLKTFQAYFNKLLEEFRVQKLMKIELEEKDMLNKEFIKQKEAEQTKTIGVQRNANSRIINK